MYIYVYTGTIVDWYTIYATGVKAYTRNLIGSRNIYNMIESYIHIGKHLLHMVDLSRQLAIAQKKKKKSSEKIIYNVIFICANIPITYIENPPFSY